MPRHTAPLAPLENAPRPQLPIGDQVRRLVEAQLAKALHQEAAQKALAEATRLHKCCLNVEALEVLMPWLEESETNGNESNDSKSQNATTGEGAAADSSGAHRDAPADCAPPPPRPPPDCDPPPVSEILQQSEAAVPSTLLEQSEVAVPSTTDLSLAVPSTTDVNFNQQAEGEADVRELSAKDRAALREVLFALGCWLCNIVSTEHLLSSRVARAFGYTRCSENWLTNKVASIARPENVELWLQLRVDCLMNSAELAFISDDLPKAILALQHCANAQSFMKHANDPENIHICLAEALLEAGRAEEATNSAANAVALLRPRRFQCEESKVYALLVALALEQASSAASAANHERVLKCFSEAEGAWALRRGNEQGPSPWDGPAADLLHQMRVIHEDVERAARRAARDPMSNFNVDDCFPPGPPPLASGPGKVPPAPPGSNRATPPGSTRARSVA